MWARGDQTRSQDWKAKAIRDAKAIGLTLDLASFDHGDEDGLWEENLPAWQAWCAVASQWRTEALSGFAGSRVIWIGLDYAAAKAGLDLAGIDVTPELWADVRAIEEGATKELNRER